MNQTRVVAAELDVRHLWIKRMISFSVLGLLLTAWTLVWSQNTSYHLIAGSFKTLKSANELVDALSMKGYSPVIIFPNTKSSNYRVSVFSATDRSVVSSYKRQMPGASKYWTLSVNGAGLRSSTPTATTTVNPPNYGRGTLAGTPLYHVVVGSFPSRDAALRSQGARQTQGFDAYILDPDPGSGSYRLAVYRSANRKEVETYRQQLLRSGKVASSWIHEQRALTGSTATTSTGSRVVGGVYHLIGGSFKNFADADLYKEQMEGRGYSSVILFPKPGVSTTYRVSILRSAVRADVKTAKDRYRAQTKKDSWIYFER